MKYRNKRQVELEKQFIKEYIKKNSKKGGVVNTEKVSATMSETTTSKAAPGESKTRASMNEEESQYEREESKFTYDDEITD